jgi:hypothetical protein
MGVSTRGAIAVLEGQSERQRQLSVGWITHWLTGTLAGRASAPTA